MNPSSLNPSKSVRQHGLDAKSEDSDGRAKPLLILSLAERLIVDAQSQLNKIPRSQRFRYGAHLGDALYRLPELIVQAASARTNKTKVYALCDHLRILASLMRIGAESSYIDSRWLGRINRPRTETDKGGEFGQVSAIAFTWRASLKG